MKSVLIFLLCTAVTLRALAAPAEEALLHAVKVKEAPKPQAEAVEELPHLAPEAISNLCLPGWEFFRGSCYHLNNQYNTWKDAVSYCAVFEATLASVHSFLENNQFQHMAGTAGHTTAWTGGYHFEGIWRWQDGSRFGFNHFESISSTSANRCVRMNTQVNRGWYNTNCNSLAPSICQIKVNC